MKNLLSPYLQPIKFELKNPKRSVSLEAKAYRMDDLDKDMRSLARVGAVFSCDYLHIDDKGCFLLVEDTLLEDKVSGLEKEYESMDEIERGELVKEKLRYEHCLKVYGSTLMLCRLCKNGPDRCLFWLVVLHDDKSAGRSAKFVSGFGYDLECSLKGTLCGGKLTTDVEVITLDEFRARAASLSPCAPPP